MSILEKTCNVEEETVKHIERKSEHWRKKECNLELILDIWPRENIWKTLKGKQINKYSLHFII